MGWRKVHELLTSVAAPWRVSGWVRAMAGAVILAVVLAFFARRAGQTMDMVREAWQPVSWLYLVLSFLLLIVCLFIMALMWYGVLRTMGGQLSLSAALRFYGITLLPRYIPGMVWGYAGRTLLCEREGVAQKIAAGSAVAEMGLIVTSGLVMVLAKFLACGWIVVIAVPTLILVLGFLVFRPKQRRKRAYELKRAANWYGLALAYIGFWLLYGASSWLVALSVAPEVARPYPLQIIVSSAIAWLVGFVAVFVPSGLGIREGVFSLTLTPIVGPAAGVFIPLLARLISMLAEVTFFLLCLLLFHDSSSAKISKDREAPPS